jgi:hypothetical protein
VHPWCTYQFVEHPELLVYHTSGKTALVAPLTTNVSNCCACAPCHCPHLVSHFLLCCCCCCRPAVNATKTAGSTAVNATTSVAKDVGSTITNATTAVTEAVTPKKSGATSVTASAAIAGAAVLGSAMLLLL